MFIIQILFFLVLILAVAYRFKLDLAEAVPVGTSLLVLLLYVLSFFGALQVVDYIAVAVLVAAVAYLFIRREALAFVRQALLDPAALAAILMTLIMSLAVRDKVVSWWDDYNFWATDVKGLFYLDGFAGKYANVAPEFGDYPPGTQMMKWWFLHLSPDVFREGLMFAGYYFMNLAFLFPMLSWIKRKKPWLVLPGAVMLWLFPGVAEVFWMDGCCADLTMALVYGAFLVSVLDGREKGRFFYYGRQALFLMILVLCKNTGFLWVGFGLLFDYGYHLFVCRKKMTEMSEEGRTEKKRNRYSLLLVTLLPVLAEGSWLLFCLLRRRVAKLTGTAVKMATGSMNIPDYQEEMVDAFKEAFIRWPLHRNKTWSVDLSPLALYLLLLLFVLILWKMHLIEKKPACWIFGFMAVSGAVFYTFNLVSHLTIFAVESQYLEPYGMVSSIERYGAPFMLGGLYLIFYLGINRAKSARGFILCMLFVLLTTDYQGAYRALWGYRSMREEVLAEREEIVDPAAEAFLQKVGAGQKQEKGRVLYFRDASDVSWVRNTYVGFEAAPVSVMYGYLDADSMNAADVIKAVEDAHAEYVYVDELLGNGGELFAPLLMDEDMEYGCVYRVEETAGELKLRKQSEG